MFVLSMMLAHSKTITADPLFFCRRIPVFVGNNKRVGPWFGERGKAVRVRTGTKIKNLFHPKRLEFFILSQASMLPEQKPHKTIFWLGRG